MEKNFSIIIPTLNEAANIEHLLAALEDVLRGMGANAELLIVDDGSSDGTRELVHAYQGRLDLRLICRDSEQGLTGAVVTGAHAARWKHAVVMDGDLSHPPELLPALISPLLAGESDMVIGSRYTVEGSTPDWPWMRRFGSQIASAPARLLTAVQDPLSGFFAVHTELIQQVDKNLQGFKIGLEILATNASLTIREVPITFVDRAKGTSKMSKTVCQEYFRQLLRLASQSLGYQLSLLIFTGLFAGFLDYEIFRLCRLSDWPLAQSHITSLLGAAHLCYFSLMFGSCENQRKTFIENYGRFIVVVLLSMFLRGGIIGLPVVAGNTSPYILPSVIIFTGCVTWLLAFFSARLRLFRLRSANWPLFGMLSIFYVILLRLVYSGNIELIQEEAYYWNYSRHLATGYLDHPPMVALLIRLGTSLFGDNEFGVRFGPFLCWFITAFFCYRLTRTVFDRATAFKALILAAVLPIFFGVGLLSTPDAPLVACWAGVLYFFYLALVEEQTTGWYMGGMLFGLGLCSKYTIIFLGPAVLLYMITQPSGRKWLLRPQPYIAAFIALVFFSPVILWNYQNNWASFLFQSQGRIEAASEFSTHLLLISALILLTPTGLFSAVYCLSPKFSERISRNVPKRWWHRERYCFFLLMTAVPLTIFFLFSLTKEVKLNWIGPVWLATIPLVAFSMEQGQGRMGRWLQGMWPGTVVAIMLIYGGLLHYCVFGLPGTSYVKSVFLFGWDDLAVKVDDLVEHTPHPALVVGMDSYRTASGLAFYRHKANQAQSAPGAVETTGRQLFGQYALMYEYWFSPDQALGHDIVVVADRRDKLAPDYFQNHYGRLGEIKEITINKRGKIAGRYYYRILSSYKIEGRDHGEKVTSMEIAAQDSLARRDS